MFSRKEKAPCLERAHSEITAGLRVAADSSLEHKLLQALALRYPTDPECEDFAPYNDALANALRPIHADHPDDLDVMFFFVESLMNRTPWQLWDIYKGAPNPDGSSAEARHILETAFQSKAAWDHPGLLHMYIHLMEMSPTPEAALPHGDRLTSLCPDSGHLCHMASHVDVLCGDYQSVVARNHRAATADLKFVDHAGRENFYALYRIHNLHFKIYGAMFLGQKATAMAAADKLSVEVPEAVVRVYPELFEAYVTTRPHVMVRFGMWEDILNEPIPTDLELYAFTHALLRYARTVALANLGQHDEAQSEAEIFHAAFDAIPEKRMLFQNKARDVLEIARNMMLGEMAYKSGDIEIGFEHLRQAVKADDGLMYEEPWAWPQPARHALGALLLESGRLEEAEKVYRADLGLDPSVPRALQNPNNIWALHGLHECLQKRGEEVEIKHIRAQLDRAAARADIRINASCFCRKSS